jgi:hypothetical protein
MVVDVPLPASPDTLAEIPRRVVRRYDDTAVTVTTILPSAVLERLSRALTSHVEARAKNVSIGQAER